MEVTEGFERILQEYLCVFAFLGTGACFEYEGSGLSFLYLVSSLASYSRIWDGSEEMLMVSGSAKIHEVCRLSEMEWSSLSRGEEWVGRGGMGFFCWMV